MISYSEKITNEIEERITGFNASISKGKVEMVSTNKFANVGHFYAQPQGAFENILEGKFAYQDDYASIEIKKKDSAEFEKYHIDYSKPRLEGLLNLISDRIAVYAQRVKKGY